MDEMIKSLYLRLDANTSTLARSAIGQILVKIIYSFGHQVSKEEIFKTYAQLNNISKADESQLSEILEELVDKDIRKRDGKYYLSTNKKDRIKKVLEQAEDRKNEIIDIYFSNTFSDRIIIEDWLQDVTIKFFECYSDEWISDLLTGHKAVSRSETSIKDLIAKRTFNNKQLDNRDRQSLPKLFFNFINDNKGVVNDYLWDYGTSAFAAKLIRNQKGVDSLTIKSFKNSTCILDTNILLFISLESRFKDGIIALEKVFHSLNVEVAYLYITQKEYQNKVYSQKNIMMHNLDKFGYDIASIPNDDFTNSAKELQCKTTEDFERFFEEKAKIPSKVHDTLPIKILDNDKALVEIIEKAQNDNNKIDELNRLFCDITGRDKKQNALVHDVGLLKGVEYLRKTGKYFVVSEEVCVNLYSKKQPLSDNLPLAIRIDTLINVLAANNDGETFNASDYVPLFANIVRTGLTPDKDTFRQEELYNLYEMDEQVAQLPNDKVKEIVMEMHELILKGNDEKILSRELKSKITKGKIKVVSDLDETRHALNFSERERERQEKEKNQAINVLKETLTERISKEYDKETNKLIRKYRIYYPVICFIISVILVLLFVLNTNTVGTFLSFLISFLVNIVFNWYCNMKLLKEKISERNRRRESQVAQKVEEEFKAKIQL